MARLSTMCVLAVVAACGSKSDSPAPTTGSAPPPVGDAGVAPATVDAAPSGPTCEVASFAAVAACEREKHCVTLYEVTAACTVRKLKELALTVENATDIAWPRRDGPLYVVVEREAEPRWAWGAIAAPLTADAKAVDKIAWQGDKLGDGDVRGPQFGLVTDGADVALMACTGWVDDNEEEWHCETAELRSLTTKKLLADPPLPPFTKPFAAGAVTEHVTLRKKRKKLECKTGKEKFTALYQEVPVATATLDADTYFLVGYDKGSRGTQPGVTTVAMHGCSGSRKIAGDIELGPSGYWAALVPVSARNDDTARIYRRGSDAPLVGADGKPFGFEADAMAWAAP